MQKVVRNVIVTNTAEAELRFVTEYLSFFGTQAANSFIKAFQSKITLLKEGVVEFPLARDPDLAQAKY